MKKIIFTAAGVLFVMLASAQTTSLRADTIPRIDTVDFKERKSNRDNSSGTRNHTQDTLQIDDRNPKRPPKMRRASGKN